MLHLLANPFEVAEEDSYEYLTDGMIVLVDGHIVAVGPAPDLLLRFPDIIIQRQYAEDALIVPGFIDSHLHYTQTDIVAAYGEQLLDWLNLYAFPTEIRFANPGYADEVSRFFFQELLRCGTTTAMVFGSVHTNSVEAFFREAERLGMRMIAGKVMMDRNAPPELLDTAQTSYDQSKQLIETWHKRPGSRLQYAITPRFAPTSTPQQLQLAGKLKSEHPDVYIQTHWAENVDEMKWVAKLFPQASDYLNVYESYGLLSDRTILAHGIHATALDLKRIAASGSAIAFCPTSNLFLGSGLFNLGQAVAEGVNIAVGTDIGAGTSFSLLRTLGEAYNVAQLQRQKLSAIQSLYLVTLGAARTLQMQDKIGNFQIGKEADFVVLDLHSSPLMMRRMQCTTNIKDKLFLLLTMCDAFTVRATIIHGNLAYEK